MTISHGRLGRSIVPLVAVNLAALAYFLLTFSSHGIGFAPYHIDLDVYRIGSRTWLDGRGLYGKLPPTRAGIGLPFSYPPIAAVLLTPLALLPMTAAGNLLSLITAGLTALVLRVFLTAVRPARASWRTVAWHDSVRYWTSIIFQTGRPGNPAYAANQSIQAVVARAGLDPHAGAGLAVLLVAAAAVLVLACFGMRRAVDQGQDVWALSLNAFAALLISPISWSHHWVWGETAMLVLACLSLDDPCPARRRRGLAFAAAGTVIFAVAPQWWLPSGSDQELQWAVWEQIAGSSYAIMAVIALAASATSQVGRRPLRALAEDSFAQGRYAIYLGVDLSLAGSEGGHGCGLRDAGE